MSGNGLQLSEDTVIEVPLTDEELAQCASRRMLKRTVRSTRAGKLKLSYESGKTQDGKRIVPQELSALVPSGKCFGFDTIWDVTRMRYHDCLQREEIQTKLPFHISTGSVSNLSREGLVYFMLCQFNAAQKLGCYFRENAFILNIDGTNEGGAYTHYRCIDNATGIVVFARKIKSENAEDIADVLREVIRLYGKPHAVVSDMSGPTRKAIVEVFGENFPHIICQFHFLRDVGKELLGQSHEKLRESISKSRITVKLKRYLANVKALPGDINEHEDFEKVGQLLSWCLDYRSVLTGKGMPFDLAWLEYYKRMRVVFDTINELYSGKRKSSKAWQTIINIKRSLESLLSNRHATGRYNKLCALCELFNELRNAFYYDTEETEVPAAPLSLQSQPEENSCDSDIIRLRLGKLIADAWENTSDGQDIIKKHLEKYLPFLTVKLVVGDKVIPLPRTNNMSEINYRDGKRNIRRTTGKKNLAKALDLLPAEIAYISNIDNEQYMRIVYADLQIYDMFASVSPEEFRDAIDRVAEDMPEYLVGKPIRSEYFIQGFKLYFSA